ncbi:L,D-transpeptidase family protein [Shewanella oncorhynchi]|uniref:L,D-transpeptidase family protein n=2 Tax=Shewanella oncorhynchi TaxID=2726434 RepID=A0AA50KAA0_9GAMM|nr:L,D-transpeptidase family protein [Shewanella oncorhynchi]WMB71307.1 L,D-transpeptidase family protein [Shewanella oncorhynchi]
MILKKIIRYLPPSMRVTLNVRELKLIEQEFNIANLKALQINSMPTRRNLAQLLLSLFFCIPIILVPKVSAADGAQSLTSNSSIAAQPNLEGKAEDLTAVLPLAALVPQVLLLDLAGVNPVFGQHYRDLTLSPNTLSTADLVRIQADVTGYWHYVMTSAECNNAGAPETVSSVIPEDPQYQRVLKQIAHLVQLDTIEPWETLVLDEKLTLGMSHQIVDTIAKRVWILGDLATEPRVNQVYTEELMIGIKRFQQKHGLKQDGVIGKQTLFWVNQSPRARAVLLAKNTIRQRVFERKLEPSYLLINVPAFEMTLVDNGTPVLSSKVIVGKSSRQTPILDSQISSVVLNPSWRVPSSILRRDILPQIQRNGHYLKERQFDVYDYNGQQVQRMPEEWQALASASFPYQLVQRPGAKNALGKYKFHFDNSFSVYLHGTSEPSLFKKDDRALSSGCIRIEKATELAQWFKEHLVKDKRLWDKLAPGITEPQWFSLSEKLPVHLVYWTAWLDDSGQEQYRRDIYHLEPELTNAVPATVLEQH